ncbi:DUF6541 family protein [Dermabacter hominis]|uniref:DUF6541 family protein n=1 Tax=Dermabacter hominis TaxID=36740 RepID=UPI00223B4C43|nr:DUF6541 family protein [Dermabacter hominis]MCT2025073.1 hypothetical protein [Dermabacter hominis]
MTWQPLLLPAIVACLWVTMPGFLVNIALGCRRITALLLSPLSSVGLIVAAAILAPFAGIGWGPLPVAIVTVACAAGSVGLRFLLQKAFGTPVWNRHRDRASWRTRLLSPPILALITIAGSFALMLRHVRNILGTPYAFSQAFDAIFHLNEVRWMIEHRNGSSLTAQEMISAPWQMQFYPAAWHDIASLTGLTTGIHHVSFLTNATIIATLCVIWPLSMIALVYVLTPGSILRSTLFPTGVILAALPAFPFTFVEHGVLYPNLLGYCLLPSLYVPFLALLGQAKRLNIARIQAIGVGALGSAGTAFAHPTAALMMLAGSSVMTLYFFLRMAIKRPPSRDLILFAGVGIILTAMSVVSWIKIRPPGDAAETWGPDTDTVGAIGAALIHRIVNGIPQYLVLVLVVLAIVGALRTRFYLPLVLWILSAFFWIVAASWPMGPARRTLVGPWYSDVPRLYAQMGLFLIPAAAIGVGYACAWLARKTRLVARTSLWRTGLAAALSAVLVATTQANPMMDSFIDRVERVYTLDARTNSVNRQELTFILNLPNYVGPNDKIFVNPWRGEGLAYAFSGVNLSTYHLLAHESRADVYLIKHLNQIDSDPVVCEALKVGGYTHIMYFSGPEVDFTHAVYAGLQHLDKTKKLELVYQNGNAYLYRVTGCAI